MDSYQFITGPFNMSSSWTGGLFDLNQWYYWISEISLRVLKPSLSNIQKEHITVRYLTLWTWQHLQFNPWKSKCETTRERKWAEIKTKRANVTDVQSFRAYAWQSERSTNPPTKRKTTYATLIWLISASMSPHFTSLDTHPLFACF